jgi:DNA-binding transcriptional MerR regulator
VNHSAEGGPDGLTVGAAAAHTGVTVRTLHHWDTIGLVRPSERTTGGYRLYSAADLARVHRVLVYRELGLPLDRIGALLDADRYDPISALEQQRAQLVDRIARLSGMVEAVDRMLDAARAGIRLSAREQVEIFGQRWQPDWVTDAHARWGDTPQWGQYAERVAHLTRADWERIAAQTRALEQDLAAAARTGLEPGSAAANALAERHRAAIGGYFDCTHAMHVCLGRRYAADPGFTAHYDGLHPGLTEWLRDAINANARAHGVDPDTATWT